MAKLAGKETVLKELFDTTATTIKDSQKEPTMTIKAIQVLASSIDQEHLAERTDICALVATEMKPRLAELGIPKGDRWFRKYLDAKYKRAQAKEPLHDAKAPSRSSAADIAPRKTRLRVNVDNPSDEGRKQVLGCARCGYGPEAHTAETTDRCLAYVTGAELKQRMYDGKCTVCGQKLPKKEKKAGHKICAQCVALAGKTVENVKMEKCPDCGVETPNPSDLGELSCSGCGQTFYISTMEAEELPQDPAKKAIEATVAKTEEKAMSEVKVADGAEFIMPFADLNQKGQRYPWTKVPTFLKCLNAGCNHHKVKHSLSATKGQRKCEEPSCPCKDFIVDTRKLPQLVQRQKPAGSGDGGPAATKKKAKQTPLEKQIEDQKAVIKVVTGVGPEKASQTDTIESTAIISMQIPGMLATPENVLKELLTGPVLEKTNALYAVQKALREKKGFTEEEHWKFVKKAKEEINTQNTLIDQLKTQLESFRAGITDEHRDEVARLSKELKAKGDHLSTVLQDNNRLREQLKEVKKELAERATKAESEQVDLLKREIEEYKSENNSLKEQLAGASFTTADQIKDFQIFVTKKQVPELVKVIDTMNWKKALGLSIRTDGKFGTGFKVGAPE